MYDIESTDDGGNESSEKDDAEKVNLRKDFILRILPKFPDNEFKLKSAIDKVSLFENEILRYVL